jgi:uncharacterized protein (TIGR03083 family)
MTDEVIAAEPWLAALDVSSERTRALVVGLTEEQLEMPSFDKEWTIAQVLSHLGSGAEIGAILLDRALVGDSTPMDRELALPIWKRWDAMTPLEQRAAWYEADASHRAALASLVGLGPERLEVLRIPFFAGPVTASVYAGYRLSEQTLHGWDIAVALNPVAVIPLSELSLLWDRIDLIASRVRDEATLERLRPQRVAVTLTDDDATYRLDLTDELHLIADDQAALTDATGTLAGPADAVLRLVYGRNRPADEIEVSGPIGLDDYRALFPGF